MSDRIEVMEFYMGGEDWSMSIMGGRREDGKLVWPTRRSPISASEALF